MSIEFVCPECLRATLHGGTCGNTWEADCPLKIRWSCRGDFTVLSIIYLVDFVLVDLVLFRFVRHTVTNLTYLDKVSSSDYYLNFSDSVKPNQNIKKYLTWQGDWGGGRSEEDDCKRSMAYQVWISYYENPFPSIKISYQISKYLPKNQNTKFENTLPSIKIPYQVWKYVITN